MVWTATMLPDSGAVWRLAGLAILMVIFGFFEPGLSKEVTTDAINRVLCVAVIAGTAAVVRYERSVSDRLARQTRRAEAADRAMLNLFASLSHELRTPLNAVLGFAQLLRANARPDQIMPITQIERAGQRLLGTFENLFDLTRAEQRTLQPATIDIGRILTELVVHFEPIAEERQQRLRIAPSSEKVQVVVDHWALNRILSNLISNAIKFGPVGGEVLLSASGGDGTAVVRVKDAGPGMPPAVIERLGDLFFQAETGAARGFEGLGAGLALTTRLARSIGAQIDFDSRPGAGTRVTVSLPAKPPADQASR
jgi:signal transduction histidine kinase